MSHLFQRPLCEMGAAFDFAFRPTIGEPPEGDGGPCDDRPHRIELYAAGADRSTADAAWRAFLVCPEHEAQLRRYDARLAERGLRYRFRTPAPSSPGPGGGR